ncbi:D-aminoacylase [Phenylobacterium sp.]|uniref:N-acyl-D-amino-acid deacylase family protein n=1 Tax=Phenylobacterium sp. TaxID=1871053 RepID=UPI002E3189EE|nr:D-aminoacylase [Phenylobacterium sp.]HEX4709126.1 D-aminoacylase [Phenylobacterium sp.]
MKLFAASSLAALAAAASLGAAKAPAASYDVVIRGGEILDGSGGKPMRGDVAVKGDRIAYVGPHAPGRGKTEIDATGKAVAPGFINMLSHSEDSLWADGRGLSELRQGVTLEVMGEGSSAGPLTPKMQRLEEQRQHDIKFPVTWTTLDQGLEAMTRKGVSLNLASFVGAATVRVNVLGEDDVQPTPEQLARMRTLVDQAMEDGAMGVGSALIYAPGTFAKTDELAALTAEAGRCGGIYISHMRSEGDHIFEATDELIEISQRSGAPAEVFHMKTAGKDNWAKEDAFIGKIEAARARGQRITADMYTYPASSTGFDAAMPTWVQAGGVETWIARLKDPATRAKVLAEMRQDHPKDWENSYRQAGPDGTLLVGFKSAALKPLTGKTLAEVAKERGTSPEDTIIDLIIADGSRIQVVYSSMNEANVAKQMKLPWVSFGSDASAQAPEGVFLLSSTHPRAYGNFVRVLGKYSRDEKLIALPEAVRRLAALPAHNLGLHDRGRLQTGYYADIVVFDPKTVADHATFLKPQQLATGVTDVLVNGQPVLKDSEATGAHAGRVVRGRAWKGWKDGGCRASAKDWSW